MAMPARTCRCIFLLQEDAEGAGRHLRRSMTAADYGHGLLGSNVNGSSLPHLSGTPDCRNLAVRTLCRWQASWIICGVAPPLGAVAAGVKSPALGLVVGLVDVDVVGVVGWADAD